MEVTMAIGTKYYTNIQLTHFLYYTEQLFYFYGGAPARLSNETRTFRVFHKESVLFEFSEQCSLSFLSQLATSDKRK